MEETDGSITNDINILSTTSLSYRVKFYKLDDEGNWEDMGTGVCEYMENSGSDPDRMEVQSDSDSSLLVTVSIQPERTFNRQDDTLLIWAGSNNDENALSFLEADALNEIWRKICEKLDGLVSNESTDEYSPGDHDEDDDDDSVFQEQGVLPQPNFSNLPRISSIISNVNSIQEKDQLISFILSDCYTPKLFPVFQSCEDLELTDNLHHLYTIMKSIILLGDNTIIEQIVEEDNFMSTVGILEYDPITPDLKANHREVLKKQSEIETVVPVDDVVTVVKIYETLRLQYLQNVICADYLDRKVSDVFHNLITCNHVDIIESIQHNVKFLTDLFNLIINDHSTDTDKTKGVQCVLQLCSISKSIPDESRVGLFSTLATHGLFDIFEIGLFSEDESIRVTSVNVLNSIVELSAPLVRRYILIRANDDTGKRNLLDCILDRFTTAADELLKLLYLDIIILILTPNGVQTNTYARRNAEMSLNEDPQVDDVLSLFYDKCIHYIMRPLQLLEDKPMKLTGPVEALQLDCEHLRLYSDITQFICFAIRYHGYRSKYFILSSDLIPKLTQLYRSLSISMKLDTLRVFRTCVGQLDDFYHRSLIKHNIFEPTIRVLLDTNRKYNALNSACIELFDFIHTSNIKILLTHVVENYGAVLDTQNYVKTFKSLRERYDKNRESLEQSTESETDISTNSEINNHESTHTPAIDKDEEYYFNTSDDEEEEEQQPQQEQAGSPILLLINHNKLEQQQQEENSDEDEESRSSGGVEDDVHEDDDDDKNNSAHGEIEIEKDHEIESIKENQHDVKSPTKLLPLKNKTTEDDDDEDDEIGKKLIKKIKTKEEEQQQPKFLKRLRKLKDEEEEDEDDMLIKKQKAVALTKKQS